MFRGTQTSNSGVKDMNIKHLIKPVAVLAFVCGAPVLAGAGARRRRGRRTRRVAGRHARWRHGLRSAAWARAMPLARSAAASSAPTRCVVTRPAPSNARVKPPAVFATACRARATWRRAPSRPRLALSPERPAVRAMPLRNAGTNGIAGAVNTAGNAAVRQRFLSGFGQPRTAMRPAISPGRSTR